jgi:HEAT repeat protein
LERSFLTNLDQLVQRLSDRNTKARLEAANDLARLGDAAIEPVTKILKENDDFTIRRLAAFILGKIGKVESVEDLVEALGDDNPDVRKSAAQALNRIGEPAIPLLIRALGNISKDVRASAVWALSKMGDIVINPLLEALSSDVKDVRASAVWALSKVGVTAMPGLLEKMVDPDKNVRESAIWGLAKIGEPAVRKLAELWNIRIGAKAQDGEKETDSVDVEDLVKGGENSIKQWIKFINDQRNKPADVVGEAKEPAPEENSEESEEHSEDQ